MTQMEKNSDIVVMNCYAPMFVNVNPGARQWRPNLIGYDGLRVYGSPSYYAIKLFSTNLGDEILKTTAADTEVLTSVTRDSKSGTIYAKLVNASDADAPVQIAVTGAGSLASTATALTLSGDAQATNAIDTPDRVVPVTSTVSGVKSGFTYTVPKHGIVVLTMRTPLTPPMWEERWHPLREEWVIVAAHRQSRPWSGAEVTGQARKPPAFDATCYLCPGNPRVGGAVNPAYTGTFVFDNDHPCVGVDAPRGLRRPIGIYRSRPATGVARVVCYSPRHDLTLAELDVDGVDALLETWQQQMRELATHPDVNFVLIFENKGEVVGVSNPHPHCQIYATNFTFKYIETELRAGRRHLERDRPDAVPGHHRRRASGRSPDRLTAWQRHRVRALLRTVCLRDLRRAAAQRGDHCRIE